ELLTMDAFEPREELKIEQVTKRKGNEALSTGIDIVFLHLHLGASAQQAFKQGRHFRAGDRLQLGVNTGGMFFDVPIDGPPPATIAPMPLAQQVLIPGAEVFGVRGT